jgi:integrase
VDRADRKGGEPRAFWLNADRVGAWEAFMYAAAWPKDVRPYQARHSMALELGERGIDLADVSAVLGHRQIATTRKHYAPVLVSRLKDATERLAGRFKGWQADEDGSDDGAGHGSNSPGSDTATTDTNGTVH